MHVSIVLCLSLVHYGNLHPLYGYPRGTVGENYAYLTFCMSRPPSNSIPTLGLHNRNTIIVDFQMRPPFLCVNVRWVTFLCAERKVVFPMINTSSRALDIKLPKCFKVINNRLCKIFALVIKTCAILRKNRRVFCRAARQTSWTAQWADNAISAFHSAWEWRWKGQSLYPPPWSSSVSNFYEAALCAKQLDKHCKNIKENV